MTTQKLTLTLFILAIAPAAFAQKPLESLVGNYKLSQATAGDCLQTTRVEMAMINTPLIRVISLDGLSTGFEVPARPSAGYPTERKNDIFEVSYGPSMEYDGPACNEKADFSQESTVRFTKTCDFASTPQTDCTYLRTGK